MPQVILEPVKVTVLIITHASDVPATCRFLATQCQHCGHKSDFWDGFGMECSKPEQGLLGIKESLGRGDDEANIDICFKEAVFIGQRQNWD